MSLAPALQEGLLMGMDATAGLFVGSAVETFAPPISTQGPLQLFLEAMVQLITIGYLAKEGSTLLHRGGETEETIGYYIGVIAGMPNTFAKFTLVTGYAKGWLKSIIFPVEVENATLPPGPAATAVANAQQS